MSERASGVLVIEDDPSIAESLVEDMGREGLDVLWESPGARGVRFPLL